MQLSPISELLLRNIGAVGAGDRLLWINPEADDAWRDLTGASGALRLWCQDYAAWQHLEDAGSGPEFGDFPDAGKTAPDHCILTLPHGKPRLEMMLDMVRSLLPPHGRLWLVGENRAGIRSCVRHLRARFGDVRKLDNARHCALFEATGPIEGVPFRPDDYRLNWTTGPTMGDLKIASWPGVFAHGRLDEGTELLLRLLPDTELGERVLDFACGCGVVGARVAALCSECDITMVDVDALALRASGETLAANGFSAQVVPGNGFRHLDGVFDTVLSNPPFHQGARTNTQLGMQILEPLRNFLRLRGQFLMVANRHLPYRNWLGQLFGQCEVMASTNKYHVLRATNQAVE